MCFPAVKIHRLVGISISANKRILFLRPYLNTITVSDSVPFTWLLNTFFEKLSYTGSTFQVLLKLDDS